MSRSRPVPGIQQQRHTFQPGNLGAVQSPLGQPPPQQAHYQPIQPQPTQAEVIAEQMHELAATIYCDLATNHIERIDNPDPDTLRRLAINAQTAAKAYFESIGVQFDG